MSDKRIKVIRIFSWTAIATIAAVILTMEPIYNANRHFVAIWEGANRIPVIDANVEAIRARVDKLDENMTQRADKMNGDIATLQSQLEKISTQLRIESLRSPRQQSTMAGTNEIVLASP